MSVETTKMEAFFLVQKHCRGDLGKSLVADAVTNVSGVATLDDISEFQYSKLGSNDLDSLYIWRYNQTDDDEVRRVIRVIPSTGRVHVDGTWADESDLDYVLIGFDPRKVLDAMDAGYGRMMIRKDVVLTIGGHDLDMEEEGESRWDGYTSNVDVLKEEAEPQNKVTGTRSLKITLTGNAGSLLSEPIGTVPGITLKVVPCLRVASGGPFTVRLWDTTNSAYFGTTLEYAGGDFAYLFMDNAIVPDDCSEWQLEIAGTAANDVAYLDSVAARAITDTRFDLPEEVSEGFRLPLIHRVGFKGGTVKGAHGVYPARSREYQGDLVLNVNYQVEAMQNDANPAVLAIEPGTELREDIFYLMTQRERESVEPWENKTDVTTAPRGELEAYLMYEICDLLAKETREAYWTLKKEEWANMLGQEAKPRAELPYQPAREVIRVKL